MTIRPLTILIVGGYGTFGGRLAELLAEHEGLRLLIGGRSLALASTIDARESELARAKWTEGSISTSRSAIG